jgi:hypothetical protein
MLEQLLDTRKAQRTQQYAGLWQVETIVNLFRFSPILLWLNLQMAWVCKPLLTRCERILKSTMEKDNSEIH